TLDGYVAVPGKGISRPASERVAVSVHLDYGGGVTTVVGPDTVGVPGGIALFGRASEHYGKLPWKTLFEPAIDITRKGFPLPAASFHYLEYSAGPIFDRSPDGRTALHHADGRLKQAGETIIVPHLADSLERIARNGPAEFYTGELGRRIAGSVIADGGRLSEQDLASYRVIERPSLEFELDDWRIATNPPPAVGGAVLCAMLQLLGKTDIDEWDTTSLQQLIDIQRAVLGFRKKRLDHSDDLAADAAELLGMTLHGDLAAVLEAGSTCHVSAVDEDGLACSITVSAGYGSGEMPPDTGIWLNNCLGELELNKHGLEPGPPGERLPSNMAPTVALGDSGEVLAIGSPGADRITTAISQVLFNHLRLGLPIQQAIDAPRLHVEFADDIARVAYEAGLPVDRLDVASRRFDGLSMFFGGVGAAAWSPEHGFMAAADPRRTGGTWTPGP
ncbi:MAG TPA: gamma-glutamyltransferase, partial [Chromatiales bacterium]|nr:gamma-glutamyltransferase [Chromatiales bacterium]